MKTAAALFVVLIVGYGAWHITRSAAAPASGKIDIRAEVVDVRGNQPINALGARRVIYLLIFARGGGIPIGHAFLSCVFLGQGGVLGGGVSSCGATYRLPRGYLTASGIRHSPNRYTLAITGGTGFYAGAGGTLVTTRLSGGDLRLQFILA